MNWLRVTSFGSAFALAACGGVSAIGHGEEAGGTAGSASSMGGSVSSGGSASSSGGAPTGGTMSAAGTTSTGGSTEPQCQADADCPLVQLPCPICADGSLNCPEQRCIMGQCVSLTPQRCPERCMSDQDCPVIDVACQPCIGAEDACPESACVDGKCEIRVPGCRESDPCRERSCGEECYACPPEASSCQSTGLKGACNQSGRCVLETPECPMTGQCETAMDCGTPPPVCVDCGGGTCASFACIENTCVFACPANPEPECEENTDCVTDAVCIVCPDGSCEQAVCLNGHCEQKCFGPD